MTMSQAEQITDGNGDVWRPAPSPARGGEPTYYNSTGADNWALTPTEIQQHYGTAGDPE
ncbi:hypothetical protein ABZW10_36510 [Kitasatospora sp. NPDC004723]|uniref:hypothetical protein n=1 Tax=Kitasatospora sp. NPDC004723 TaxID=3154288 RepID=UPI0033B1C2E8